MNRTAFGVVLVIVGFLAGFGFDLIFLFVGGIIQAVNGFAADPINTSDVVWGILRATVLTGIGSFLTMIFIVFPGFVMIGLRRPKDKTLS